MEGSVGTEGFRCQRVNDISKNLHLKGTLRLHDIENTKVKMLQAAANKPGVWEFAMAQKTFLVLR